MNIYICKIAQNKWAIFFAFLSLFLLGLADNIRGPLFPEILQFFFVSSSKGSWSFATTSGAAFVGSFISG
jgi:FHS family glucose/mannose:H+ symporter-like MFS transporter